ncbi:tetratricopeptide repeat protein [Streptomyces sp. NPDC046881]|uniref:tetratricopeptide repeat protein n=1 Tax=Streptomyces sp. NPDC046881 TaxID=3155374 RepID=UPI0033DE9D5B
MSVGRRDAVEEEFFRDLGLLGKLFDDHLSARRSLRSLARSARLTPTTVGEWFRGNRFPKQEHAFLRLIEVLGAALAEAGTDIAPADRHLLSPDVWATRHRAVALWRAGHGGSGDGEQPSTGDRTTSLHNLRDLDSGVFLGRTEEMQLLRKLPSTGSGLTAVTVLGMGGVGKSTLVLRHARRHLTAGRGPVWWVDAESPDQIRAGLAALARALEPDTGSTPTDPDAAARAVAWLQGRTGWLIVFDNAEDPADLRPFLGSLMTGQVVITTRRDLAWQRHGTFLRLGTLPPDQAVTVLREVAEIPAGEATKELTRLADALGGLPLALQQAGAYLAQTQIEPAAYLSYLRGDPATMLAEPVPGDAQQRTIARLWHVTLDTLRETSPDVVELLSVLAYCAPVPLPRDVLADALPTPLRVDRALGVLAAYSLITLTTADVSVHRLLQAVLRTTTVPTRPPAGAAEHPCHTALTWLERSAPAGDPAEVTDWPRWKQLEPHVQAVASHLDDRNPHPCLATLLSRTGGYLSASGHPEPALRLQERAWLIAERTHGSRHHTTGIHLGNYAATLHAAGRYAEAEPLQRTALEIAEAVHGRGHPATAGPLGNLASTLHGLGRRREAAALAEDALLLTSAEHGDAHPDTALRMCNLAAVYCDLGWYEEALHLEQDALAITRASRGEDHPDTVVRMGNLAAVHSALGQYGKALELERSALRLTCDTFGPEHPDTALRRGNLAQTLISLGQYDDAARHAEEALRITRAVYGPDHPATAVHLGNLARAYTKLGAYDRALPLDEAALAVTRAHLGDGNPDTALRLSNLSQSLRRAGRLEEALAQAEQAVAVAEASLGEEHADYAVYVNNLGAVLDELGLHEEALPRRERALAVAEKALPPGHPVTANYASNLVYSLHRLGRYERALPYARRAVETTRAQLGEQSPDLAIRLHNLAQTLLALGEREEGLAVQRQAALLAEETLGADHPHTVHVRRRLAEATGNAAPPTGP